MLFNILNYGQTQPFRLQASARMWSAKTKSWVKALVWNGTI